MNKFIKVLFTLMFASTTLLACEGNKSKTDGHVGHGGKASPAAASAADSVQTGEKAQTLCPIMKAPVNKNLYVDALGKRIYVCCPGCIQAIQADPAKYIKELEDQGIVLEKVPS